MSIGFSLSLLVLCFLVPVTFIVSMLKRSTIDRYIKLARQHKEQETSFSPLTPQRGQEKAVCNFPPI
jgi:hypothetical protein